MARQQVVTYSLTCDVCGNEIAEGTETPQRTFSFQGRDFEIDLCEKDQRGLDRSLNGLTIYVEAGRRGDRAEGRGRRSRPAAGRGRSSSVDLGKVRQWAKANGYQVSDRGRIAGALMDAYTAAHG
jgi:hypothetical protein